MLRRGLNPHFSSSYHAVSTVHPHRPQFHAGSRWRAGGSSQTRLRPSIPNVEMWLVAVVCVHLCFLPWALGTMHLWSQCVSLALAIVGGILAARPWKQTSEAECSGAGPLRRLCRFPVFWLGLAVLAYVAVQALNPAWRYRANAAYWWIEPISHIEWLPHGMDVPFAKAGPWRALLVLTSVWLTACSVWIGFSRRRALRLVFIVLVVNGVLLAGLEIAQQLTHARRIFWSVVSSNPGFAASFIYRNHAGAYLNLMVAVAAGLGWWYSERAGRRLDKSSPAGVFLFGGLIIAMMVVFSLSRGSAILLGVYLLLAGTVFLWRHFRRPSYARSHVVAIGMAVLLAGFVGVGGSALRMERVRLRFAGIFTTMDVSAHNRAEARDAALEMFSAAKLYGWGAGCFRYGFPAYVSRYPDIYYKGGELRAFWEHAHIDLLEYPIEYGVLGMTIIAAAALWLVIKLLRRGAVWSNPLSLLVVLGCLMTVAHGGMDFVFQNPAVLITWSVLLVAAVRWIELDRTEDGRPMADALNRAQ